MTCGNREENDKYKRKYLHEEPGFIYDDAMGEEGKNVVEVGL